MEVGVPKKSKFQDQPTAIRLCGIAQANRRKKKTILTANMKCYQTLQLLFLINLWSYSLVM